MKGEYRISNWGADWYPEKKSSEGVWQILKNCQSKEEAEAYLAKLIKNNEEVK